MSDSKQLTRSLEEAGCSVIIESMVVVEKQDVVEPIVKVTEADRLRKIVRSLKQQLNSSKQETADCEEDCEKELMATNSTTIATNTTTRATTKAIVTSNATGVDLSLQELARADSLSSTVALLRESRALDVTVLTWANSFNRSNVSGQVILDGVNEIEIKHREAKVARLRYSNILKKDDHKSESNRTASLKELDDEALEMVPEYGAKLVERPLKTSQCHAIHELSAQCPGHFGCSRKKEKCVSCKDASACVLNKKKLF